MGALARLTDVNNTLRRPLLTIAASAASALAVWGVAVPLAGVHLTVRQGDATSTIGPFLIVLAAVLAGLSGWILLAILRRRSPRAERAWPVIAPVVLLASLGGPSGNAVGTSSVIVLLLMHLVVGAIIILGLMPRRTRPTEV